MDYSDVELNLRQRIKPVAPDPDFVQQLNLRLREQKKVILEQSRDSFTPLLLIAGILLGIGLALFFLGKSRRK
jgi:LPXTG-motif cell wall-anchored protein